MHPSCVNGGGPASIWRLPQVPVLDSETVFEGRTDELVRCWMARTGEILTAVDPELTGYRVRLTETGEISRGVPFQRLPAPMESRLKIEIYQALPEKERFELIIQKLTELGVARIVPVETQRSITLEERNAVQAKSGRWPDVIVRAAKQCRRAMLPELLETADYAGALASAADAELKLMLYEGEGVWPVSEALGRLRPERIAVLVGPEGGFTEDEVDAARAAGFLPTGLGPRILRTETAAIAAATLLQGLLGDLC